jgi:hypothetical protein
MAHEPLSAELFREAVAVAVEEAKRDGKDVSRLQVSRIDAIVDELKKNCPGLGASLWVRQSDSMGG